MSKTPAPSQRRREELQYLAGGAYIRSRLIMAAAVEGTLMVAIIAAFMMEKIEFPIFFGGLVAVSMAQVIVIVFSALKRKSAKEELAAMDATERDA